MYRIVVFETSDIAFRRTIPAIMKSKHFQYGGFALANDEERNAVFKTDFKPSSEQIEKFKNAFGAKCYLSFDEALNDTEVDAIYLPLPPGLHFYWAKKVLMSGKHLFIEKPFVFTPSEANELIDLAKQNDLAIHVNFAFLFHKQINTIVELINNHEIFGELRGIDANFGFPFRGEQDFRYNKMIGGGAIYDCACYPILLVDLLCGNKSEVKYSFYQNYQEQGASLFGNFVLQSTDKNACGFGSYGMDNSYRCDLTVWGSKLKVFADRIFTPASDYDVVINCVNSRGEVTRIAVGADDQFLNSVDYFNTLICDKENRLRNFDLILHQSELIYNVERNGRNE